LSLAWLENNGRRQFTLHPVASAPTHLITLATGDLDGSGTPDLVANLILFARKDPCRIPWRAGIMP
jgi:hypothetical protein